MCAAASTACNCAMRRCSSPMALTSGDDSEEELAAVEAAEAAGAAVAAAVAAAASAAPSRKTFCTCASVEEVVVVASMRMCM